MKRVCKNFFLILILMVILLSTLNIMVFAKEKEEHIDDSSIVTFSSESGFYEVPFYLQMTTNNDYDLYYTLDGSTPTEESQKYSEPIYIYDRSQDDNTILKDISTYNLGGTIGTTHRIDKITVLNVLAINKINHQSYTYSKTYFIAYNNKAEYYKNMKIISLTTDPDNLYDYDSGIYTLGKTFYDWFSFDDFYKKNLCATNDPPANYKNKGKEWEREAHLSIFDNEEEKYSDNIGIRIQGHASRNKAQKSFNIYARTQYGNNKIQYNIFDNNLSNFSSFTLRNGGNEYNETKIRDKLNQALVSDKNIDTQQMQPCILFLNGEYWGIYEIKEKISKDYINQHYGINDDIVIIKDGQLEEGTIEDYDEYKNFCDYVLSTNFSSDEDYLKLCSMLDIQNYIEYMSTQIFIANADFEMVSYENARNIALWKSENYCDGKYHFILYDTDWSCNFNEDSSPKSNQFEQLENDKSLNGQLFNKLMLNNEFRDKFEKTFLDMAYNTFSYDKVEALINEYEKTYNEATCDTHIRFFLNQRFDTRLILENKIDDVKKMYLKFDIVYNFVERIFAKLYPNMEFPISNRLQELMNDDSFEKSSDKSSDKLSDKCKTIQSINYRKEINKIKDFYKNRADYIVTYFYEYVDNLSK